MAFDLFFLRQVGKNRLGVKRHDEHPIRGFYHEGHERRIIAQRPKSVFVMSNGPIGARSAFYGNLRVLRAFVVHILYMNQDNY
jgi:hypothetical protein